MKVQAIPCPCGCAKWMVSPPFPYSVDATMDKATADELVRRWNAFESPVVPTVIPNQEVAA